MEEDIQYWITLAALDLESARGSLRGDSYLHCIFGCQQALEKVLKALVVKITEQAPPRTHNLLRLLAMSGLNATPDQEQFLSMPSLEYIETRYPEELDDIRDVNNRATAETHLRMTEELFQWLEAQTKQS